MGGMKLNMLAWGQLYMHSYDAIHHYFHIGEVQQDVGN